jgi:type IV secretory pathway VirB10-like protein
VARNAFALALLMGLGLAGCSKLPTKLPFFGSKKPKAAEVNMAALRARTDSLRKARHVTDSLVQVRFTACADSVRTEMTKVVMKAKKKRKKQASAVSEDLIGAQVQMACTHDLTGPQTTVATTPAARAKSVDSVKAPAPAAKPTPAQPMDLPAAAASAPTPAAPAPATPAPGAPAPATPAPVAAVGPDSALPQTQDPAVADSVRKAREMEMSRETFAYSGAPRDPFNSLFNLAKNGPEVADLQLVGIYQNLRSPNASVAVFREKNGGKRHKLRAGDQVGRSRVMQIGERDVVFMIEDFGFERQDTLSLRKREDVIP